MSSGNSSATESTQSRCRQGTIPMFSNLRSREHSLLTLANIVSPSAVQATPQVKPRHQGSIKPVLVQDTDQHPSCHQDMLCTLCFGRRSIQVQTANQNMQQCQKQSCTTQPAKDISISTARNVDEQPSTDGSHLSRDQKGVLGCVNACYACDLELASRSHYRLDDQPSQIIMMIANDCLV